VIDPCAVIAAEGAPGTANGPHALMDALYVPSPE
jgi:hypothetical protein